LVIGAGPAGLTSTLYLSRFRHVIALVDGGASRAELIPRTRNYPGFPAGISGKDLLGRLRKQAAQYPYTMFRGWISDLTRGEDYFAATVNGTQRRAKTVVLATGIVDTLPEMEGREEGIDCGCLRLCLICDAFEVIDRESP
jgi:thioredoxin reductase (NADPH)